MQIANCSKMGGCCRPQPAVSPLWEAEPVPLAHSTACSMQRLMTISSFVALTWFFWDKSPLRTWHLPLQLSWQAIEPSESTYLHPPLLQPHTDVHCHVILLCGNWGSQARASGLHSELCKHSASSRVPEYTFVLFPSLWTMPHHTDSAHWGAFDQTWGSSTGSLEGGLWWRKLEWFPQHSAYKIFLYSLANIMWLTHVHCAFPFTWWDLIKTAHDFFVSSPGWATSPSVQSCPNPSDVRVNNSKCCQAPTLTVERCPAW